MTPHWILVDGYSVLHAWPDLPGHARPDRGVSAGRQLARQREDLVSLLQRYADHQGVRVTVVFDGYAAKHRPEVAVTPGRLEVAFSEAGKTADDLIEHWVAQATDRDGILVVTADNVERNTVASLGAQTRSVELFAAEVTAAQDALDRAIRAHNRRAPNPHREG
ncbi:NYN domain-containing protein [bacterium]|nr:NYN domain-containing protein [bacterium]